jgi:hypothetical protein
MDSSPFSDGHPHCRTIYFYIHLEQAHVENKNQSTVAQWDRHPHSAAKMESFSFHFHPNIFESIPFVSLSFGTLDGLLSFCR